MAENVTAAPWELPYPSGTGKPSLGYKDFQELAERTGVLFGEKTLIITKRAASYEAKTGELGLQESAGKTTTLPLAATANRIIAVACKTSSCKVTTSGGALIYGKWLTVASATGTVTLTEDMTAFFQSDGTNWLLWGEVKNETAPTALVARANNTEYEVSSTRPSFAFVTVQASAGEGMQAKVWAGGVNIGSIDIPLGDIYSITIPLQAGQKWKVEKELGEYGVYGIKSSNIVW